MANFLIILTSRQQPKKRKKIGRQAVPAVYPALHCKNMILTIFFSHKSTSLVVRSHLRIFLEIYGEWLLQYCVRN